MPGSYDLSGNSMEGVANASGASPVPGFRKDGAYEELVQIVGQDAYGEEQGVGLELSAGHALHREVDLQARNWDRRSTLTLAT